MQAIAHPEVAVRPSAPDLTDPTTFDAVFRAHRASVYRTALRVLGNPAQAHDVVQDVFLRMWRRPRTFDPARGEIGPYLRVVARSRALDVRREAQAVARADERLRSNVRFDDEGRVDERPAAAAERSADARAVRAALARLPEPQREALVLAYWGGLTAEEIARHARVPVGTAKSRVRLALSKMRQEYGVSPEADRGLPAAAGGRCAAPHRAAA